MTVGRSIELQPSFIDCNYTPRDSIRRCKPVVDTIKKIKKLPDAEIAGYRKTGKNWCVALTTFPCVALYCFELVLPHKGAAMLIFEVDDLEKAIEFYIWFLNEKPAERMTPYLASRPTNEVNFHEAGLKLIKGNPKNSDPGNVRRNSNDFAADNEYLLNELGATRVSNVDPVPGSDIEYKDPWGHLIILYIL